MNTGNVLGSGSAKGAAPTYPNTCSAFSIPQFIRREFFENRRRPWGFASFRRKPTHQFCERGRNHWGIENSLHWQLDVTFGEDRCRVRKGHGDANLSILRRTALSLLNNEKTAKVGIKNKRLTAGWDDDYLLKVLTAT